MKLDNTAQGLFPIAPTPFHEDGAIDFVSIDTLIKRYLAAGATGITVLGIMGEAPKMDAAESLLIVEKFVKGFHGLPVIVGVSAAGFAAMANLAKMSMALGAAGVMIAPPSHLRTDDSIISYYKQAVEAIGSDIPFVIQDYPLTLTVQMTPKVIRQIVNDNPSCVMLKHEDWPGLEKVTTLRGFEKDGSMRHISILTGNGGLFLDFEMERGIDGSMTGYAFPEMLSSVVKLMKAGKRDEAHDVFDAHLSLLRYEQQQGAGLAVRKYVMMKRGMIANDTQRKPATAISAIAKTEIDYLLSRLAKHGKIGDNRFN